MYDDIQAPPQKLTHSRFKPWYWLLLFPIYLLAVWWLSGKQISGWADFFQLATLTTYSLQLLIFAIVMLLWLCFDLIKGFAKLAECSQYEVYLAELFENRDRQRPAQNARRLDYLRKLRKLNSEVRGTTESKQKQLLVMAMVGLLLMLVGCVGQLVGQLVFL